MAIKKYGPTTPGRRGMTVTDYSVLTKVAPERSLLEPMKKHSGRNNTGRITVRHQGGGNRTKYRVIDFKRQKTDMPATVKTLEYDPNRSAFIALVEYTDGVKSYIIAPDGLKVGDVVLSSKTADIKPGNCAAAGHFKKANVAPKKTLREFRLEDVSAMNVGDVLKADVFAEGDKVDVVGVSKGKGYQGVIKRYGQHRLRESHGTGPVARHAGSNGSTSTPARVFPGKRLPGHMGFVRVTVWAGGTAEEEVI